MIQPRDYQQEAISSIYSYFASSTGNPIVVAPTGAGKSVIIAKFCQGVLESWPDQRILILTHVKELVEQNHAKLMQAWPQARAGIYSASVGRRDTTHPVIFAGVQSVYKKAFQLGRFDLVLIDECHLLNPSGEGMYNQLLGDLQRINPAVKVIGFSATPYRMKDGHLISEESLFSDICYEITIKFLIERGYLCPVYPKPTSTEFDMSEVRTRANEYVLKDQQAAFDQDDLTYSACTEIMTYGADRKRGLIFCAGVDHALHVRDCLRSMGATADTVTGSTPKMERARIINDYKAGRIKYLTNCDVLTTGFDAPETDLLAALRKTKSPGLWVQMVGRGMRTAPGKADCIVLDFAGNTAEHGPIDQIAPPPRPKKREGENGAPMRVCPECKKLHPVQSKICDACGFKFPIEESPKHYGSADTKDLLSFAAKEEEHHVTRMTFRRWQKPGKPDSMLVCYFVGIKEIGREWVCLEHNGTPRIKAVNWWRTFIDTATPRTVSDALDRLGNHLQLDKPAVVITKQAGKYPEIIGYRRSIAA